MIRRALHGKPRRVIALLAEGYSISEIADKMDMHVETVSKMVSRIMKDYQTDRAGLLDMWRNRRI